jgi:broad specificity phosphatase PhoE
MPSGTSAQQRAGASDDDPAVAPAIPGSPAEAIEHALFVDLTRTEIIFVRHGQQLFTPSGRARPGKSDPSLSELGRRQAGKVAEVLAVEPVAQIYCSQLARARETAKAIAEVTSPRREPIVIPELREVHLFRDLPADRPLMEIAGASRVEQMCADFRTTRRWDAFPYTEPSAELRARAVQVIERLACQHRDEKIVIVAHNGLINGFIAEVLGVEQDMFFYPAHASMTRALHRDTWALYSLNETGHLHEGAASLITF